MSVVFEDASRPVLERTPVRALQFLRGASSNKVIWDLLATHGYGDREQKEGWKLLYRVTQPRKKSKRATRKSDVAVAIEELSTWIAPAFMRAEAALAHRHPVQFTFVFDELFAAHGADAVVPARTFLERLDALERSPARLKTRKQDRAALTTLAQRGFTPAERRRVWKLVKLAESGLGEVGADPATAVATADASTPQGELLELRRWYADWAQTAHAVVKNRAYLMASSATSLMPMSSMET